MNGLPVRVDGRVAPGGRGRHGGLPVLVLGAWAALVLNVLTFLDLPILIPIPASLGRLIAQAALPLALVLALAANPRCVLRRTVFLSLVTALALLSLLASLHNEFPFGSIYRALRLLGLVAVLWVLTPWWGRADLVLLRCHLRCLWVVLASVVLGALVAPGDAFWLEGRLGGALWPIPPTQVGHYAAVAAGTTILLWLCRGVSGRLALLGLAVALPVLLLSHTRTALLALGIGLVLAAGSLFLGHVRVRRTSAVGAALGIVVAAAFAREITTWALRGQSTEEAGELTGRTEVWAAAMAAPRPVMERLFGWASGTSPSRDSPSTVTGSLPTSTRDGWESLSTLRCCWSCS